MLATATSSAPASKRAFDLAHRLAKWSAAHPALGVLLSGGQGPAAALRRLGLSLWSAGNPAEAAEALAESVLWAPDDAAAWLDLGFARRAAGAKSEAAAAFEQAARLAPLNARAWLALGLTFRELHSAARAESALERALALDPNLTEAAYALGLVAFDARRYAEAARHWRVVVASGFRAPGLMLGLGQCQFFLGEFGAAAQSLARHLETAPDDEAIARRLALVTFLDAAIRSGPEAGLAAYRVHAGADAALGDAIIKTAVQLLSAYGYLSTARDVALAFPAGDDPVHRHHLAALSGETATRAPADYVAAYYDGFAETFDTQLYEVLQYRGPQKLARLLAATGAQGGDTLDLGCGTGAAGSLLRPRARRLVGVDLSGKMLEKAAARGVYDEIAHADMVEFLGRAPDAFDQVFAADSLIYLGDLAPLLDAAALALRPGGVLAVSLEISPQPYELLTSGRFAHAPKDFIAAGAARGLRLRASRRSFLRLEAHRRVSAALIVLERSA